MSSSSPIPHNRGRRFAALLAIAGLALAALAAHSAKAEAAEATGNVVFTLKSGAESSLLREGVKVSPRTGKAGPTQKVKLPIAGLDPRTGKVTFSKNLRFAADGKKLVVTELVLEVNKSTSTLSGKSGGKGKPKAFFRISGGTVDGGSARAQGPVTLTGAGAKALRTALGLPGITAGKVGSGSAAASVVPTPVPAPPPAPKPVTPTPDPDPNAYPYAAQCPVPLTGTPPAMGKVPARVAGIQALPTFAPGTSQTVIGTETDWGFKASFRSYVLFVPPAGKFVTLDGATESAPGAGMASPTAYFGFPTGSGTYEAGTNPNHSDDKLVSQSTGTLLMCKAGHGFNYVIKNPTVVIDGGKSRISADVGVNQNGVWYPFQKVDLASLGITGITPEVTDGGNSLTWKNIPATMTADGETATGDLYPAGEPLDPITVKTKLDRPLLQGCTIASGIGTPPAVDFTLAALPTLSSPVKGSGGTINWGFRRGTRNTTVSGAEPSTNAFQLLGGATASFANMGGSANTFPPAENAGLGKFFRFPVASYEYEAGTPSPTDDRLIATSNATVGFCNVKFGGFGLIISKPTLVIDGADSHLVANAYSFQNGKGWAGGRVDLVDLDTGAVNAVEAGGNVSWGEINVDEDPLESGIPVDGALQTEALSLAGLTPAGTTTGWDLLAAQVDVTP